MEFSMADNNGAKGVKLFITNKYRLVKKYNGHAQGIMDAIDKWMKHDEKRYHCELLNIHDRSCDPQSAKDTIDHRYEQNCSPECIGDACKCKPAYAVIIGS